MRSELIKRDRAKGTYGWAIPDFRAVPDVALEQLAQCYSPIELIGRWPRDIALSSDSLTPKTTVGVGERPITIATLHYAVWAKSR